MIKRLSVSLAFIVIVFQLATTFFDQTVPQATPFLTKDLVSNQKLSPLHYVAIGDSLTQGVGDTTKQGGFVPLLSQKITSQYGPTVQSFNYGKAGNTSKQILKRMTEEEEIQKNLAKADFMTLTVGGNDVMAVIRKNLTSLSISSFTQPLQAYQQRLRMIFDLARKENPDLPIYVVGIYNPFYLTFSEVQEMQIVIDNWNRATQAVTGEYDKIYFVPVNDLLYKGLDGQGGLDQNLPEVNLEPSLPLNPEAVTQDEEETTSSQSVLPTQTSPADLLNNLLSDDHFHPNNTAT